MADGKSVRPLNDEWELHELVEALSAEFDHFTDTVRLKSYARGITFGLTSTDMEFRVFSRFDKASGKVLFRTAQAGEDGASVLRLTIPSLICDQIRTHEDGFEEGPDTRTLDAIGLNDTDKKALARMGVFTVDQLQKVTVNDSMRTVVSNKTGINKSQISRALGIPSIWQVSYDKGVLKILGDNLEPLLGKTVLVNGNPLEVTSTSPNQISVTVPKDITKGTITILDKGRISESITFDQNAPQKTVPIKTVTGIGPAEVKKLKAANIQTTDQILAAHDPVGTLKTSLGISDTAARDILIDIVRKKTGT